MKTGKTKPKTNKVIFITKKNQKNSILNKKKTWFLQSLKNYINLID